MDKTKVLTNGDGKLFYMAIVYGPGDDGKSGWYFKKRSMLALLKKMEKKLTEYNKPMRASYHNRLSQMKPEKKQP